MNRVVLTLPIALSIAACSKAAPPPPTASHSPATTAKPPTPDAPFEGEIAVSVTDNMTRKLPSSIVYDVKGKKVAYVPAANVLRAIGDLDAQRIVAIDDAEKTYDAIDLKPRAGTKAGDIPPIYKSATKERIAGLDCEDWTVGDGQAKVDVCAAPGIAYMDLAGDAKPGRAEPRWAAALTNVGAFPLRVLVHDKSGREQYRAEATRVERKPIDDASLEVPAGYKPANLARETRTASLP